MDREAISVAFQPAWESWHRCIARTISAANEPVKEQLTPLVVGCWLRAPCMGSFNSKEAEVSARQKKLNNDLDQIKAWIEALVYVTRATLTVLMKRLRALDVGRAKQADAETTPASYPPSRVHKKCRFD